MSTTPNITVLTNANDGTTISFGAGAYETATDQSINVASATTLAEALNILAVNAVGATAASYHTVYGVYAGNTYVVTNTSGGVETGLSAGDFVVEIIGMPTLSIGTGAAGAGITL